MANISASDVKALRDITGSGMMDCKKALTECNGNVEQAIDWLRKKGLASASRKAGRVAADGLIAISACENCATLVELNAETDFVAKNDKFQQFAKDAALLAHENCLDLESLKKAQHPGDSVSVEEQLTNLIAVIGENMQIRRVEHVGVENGVVATYVHNKISDNLGKIGVAVALECDKICPTAKELGKQIAMHIAAANPQFLSTEDVPADVVEHEKTVLRETAKATGKPDDVVEKMVVGRIRKYYEEVVLLEQVFVVDGETKIKDVIAKASKDCGCNIKLVKFVKFVLGEGIEKQQVNFAEEVAAQLS